MKRLPKICDPDQGISIIDHFPVRLNSGWAFSMYHDGTQQWHLRRGKETFIERVLSPNSRRKRWCIVERTDGCLYPPKIAGPFQNFTAAFVAAQLLQE